MVLHHSLSIKLLPNEDSRRNERNDMFEDWKIFTNSCSQSSLPFTHIHQVENSHLCRKTNVKKLLILRKVWWKKNWLWKFVQNFRQNFQFHCLFSDAQQYMHCVVFAFSICFVVCIFFACDIMHCVLLFNFNNMFSLSLVLWRDI